MLTTDPTNAAPHGTRRSTCGLLERAAEHDGYALARAAVLARNAFATGIAQS
jgi:hypothetical protein